MRDLEVPPPSASMDHFRTEVGRRAARQAQRHRRLLGGRIGVALVLALGLSLLIVRPAHHTGTRASWPAARPSGSVPRLSAPTPTGNGCPPESVCLDGVALETGFDLQGRLNPAASDAPGSPGVPSAGAVATGSVSLPAGGALRFSLRSSATEHWGIPRIASGTALRHRSTASGADGTTTTEFVPAARSGTAAVSISCTGTGCHRPSYRVEVVIVP